MAAHDCSKKKAFHSTRLHPTARSRGRPPSTDTHGPPKVKTTLRSRAHGTYSLASLTTGFAAAAQRRLYRVQKRQLASLTKSSGTKESCNVLGARQRHKCVSAPKPVTVRMARPLHSEAQVLSRVDRNYTAGGKYESQGSRVQPVLPANCKSS